VKGMIYFHKSPRRQETSETITLACGHNPSHFNHFFMFRAYLILLLLGTACTYSVAIPTAGFYLPDSVFEFTMRYRTINNLIILPVSINDSVQVNLILDTGCRNMLLFGKRFEKYFQTENKEIEFSGLGSGKPVKGKLSLGNSVSIQTVRGKSIPIIIVPEKNLFSTLPNVHGIIGYEIFAKFEIELNFPEKLITFRTSAFSFPFPEFTYLSLKVVDSKPVLEASMTSEDGETLIRDLLIDTGSALGLIVAVDTKQRTQRDALGRGLNGLVIGKKSITRKLLLNDLEFTDVNTSVVYSQTNYASIGMDILKNQVIIINYARSYVAFRNNVTS
jgi:hypothetical protein